MAAHIALELLFAEEEIICLWLLKRQMQRRKRRPVRRLPAKWRPGGECNRVVEPLRAPDKEMHFSCFHVSALFWWAAASHLAVHTTRQDSQPASGEFGIETSYNFKVTRIRQWPGKCWEPLMWDTCKPRHHQSQGLITVSTGDPGSSSTCPSEWHEHLNTTCVPGGWNIPSGCTFDAAIFR